MPDVPRAGAPNTAATASLASLAYRDGPVENLTGNVEGTTHSEGRHGLFKANLGEAFSRAVVARTLGGSRAPLVPSFGTSARQIVEHCLEAETLRRNRDRKLTTVALVAGLLFLPGTLIWLAAFKIRDLSDPKRRSLYGGIALTVAALLAVLFAWRPIAHGYVGFYIRIMMLVPVLGWFVAQRICLGTAVQMRERWNAVLDGSGVGPVVPVAVPLGPEDTRAEELRKGLLALEEEQETNVVHYAGAKGILGMGKRWGSWQLAEELDPREGVEEIRAFHPWDVIRKIEDRLNRMSKTGIADAHLPEMRVDHWVVSAIPEGAGGFSRPAGPEMDGYRMRTSAIVDLANRKQFGSDPRHYLGAQFVLWEGQLVVTMLISVRLLHQTLRVEVTGHALGPMAPMFRDKAKQPQKSVPKTGKAWQQQTKNLPIVTPAETVRLTLRAPFTGHWGRGMLDWLGGTLKLPEPFGLRSAWTYTPWSDRFMADDAMGVVAPVLRAAHKATLEVLADHDVDVDRFRSRSNALGSEVQGARPSKADEYGLG